MAQNSNIDEKKLLLELSQGSELAFTNMYNQYKNNVYSTALRITKSKIQAEEAVQDIFLKIWQNRDVLAEVDHFENYLYIISRNHLFNSIKKIARETSQIAEFNQKEAGIIDTDSNIKDEQYNTILNQIVEQLPPQQQKVYQMAKRDGLSHQKIGEDLGISTETVKKHMAQALKFIRLKISPYMNMFMSLLLFLKF
ncbi:RNA polymerase sigma factor [Flavobacterium quisquiliarum]|uniref:RNA polymerase sigma factor n=1 Tax=Flavobacterium quisquiliarum TaxID=1834436 RepID=A0ABV8W189_9FLAO|nr:RNA polymerase sigma-70 factor [Flavobacterium quisquiliarum]MBW1655150.1 RNA polymerase sigma-70 factor [Flavobacterium quisquiliarum]NWL02742.1 RNA polymerase sigma-70 factor [Flavobacterium collinsii]